MHHFRLVLAVAIAVLPSFVKVRVYRWVFGYRIGRGVRIGLSPFVGVRQCTIGDRTRIGSFNLFAQLQDLSIGECVRIGPFNVFRGGDRLAIGPYSTVLRLNVFNAIVEVDSVRPLESVLELGAGVFVGTGHWFDFTDGIRVGDHCVVGGRHSSFWTHNRQRGRPIVLGPHTYLGSEVRIAPGAEVAPFTVVALGSVLSGQSVAPRMLVGGNPAKAIRELKDDELDLVVRKTRRDIPDQLVLEALPDELRPAFERANTRHDGSPVPPATLPKADESGP